MCEWCDKDEIKDIIIYNNDDLGLDLDYGEYEENCIAYDKNINEYHLWVANRDYCFSHIEFPYIEFCPYCGRKLK